MNFHETPITVLTPFLKTGYTKVSFVKRPWKYGIEYFKSCHNDWYF